MAKKQGLQLKYFVLKPEGADIHAIASRRALTTYASVIRAHDPKMATELQQWSHREDDNAKE